MDVQQRNIQLSSALGLSGVEIEASEVHGIIVGSNINHLKTAQAPDLMNLVCGDSAPEFGAKALQDTLYDIYRANSELMLEGSAEFDLFLPDDDSSIQERTNALASWCRGYLLGLLYNDRFSIDQLGDQASEILRDIIFISEADSGDDEEEIEERALVELQEFLRVAVPLVFEEVYSELAAKTPELPQ
jgi:uncharacterized protein YgfB (UPF0149 family)